MTIYQPLQVKRSNIPNHKPASLAEGEIAANVKDGILFLGLEDNTVVKFYNSTNFYDEDALFDSNVSNGDVVYKGSDGKYYQALADGSEKSNVVGIADVTNNRVISQGFISTSYSFNINDKVYLSQDTPGAMTNTPTIVNLGIYLGNGVILIAGRGGGSGEGLPYKSKLTLSSTYTVPNDYGVVVPEKFEVEAGGELVIEENGVFMIVDNEKLEKVYAFDSERLGNIPAADYFNYEGATKYSTLNAAVEAVGSANKDLLIKGNVTVDSDLTIPENVNLVFARNGKITVNSGVTLTINGGIQAGLWQIFDGSGTITGNPKIEAVYPEWFGAKGDGVTDDTDAIQRAVDFCLEGSPILFPGNIYRHIGFTINKSISLISRSLSASWPQVETSPPITKGTILKGGPITIDGGSSSTKLYKVALVGFHIYHIDESSYALNIQNSIFTIIKDSKINSENGYGCIHTINNAWQTVIDNCYLQADSDNAIALNAEQIVVVKGLTKVYASGTGGIGCKVSGAAVSSQFYGLDCYGKGISFYLYDTVNKQSCKLYGARFERYAGDGGVALKVEGVTNYPKLVMYGGDIVSADTGIELVHAQGCRFLDVYVGVSTGGTKVSINNQCYGIMFDNCYSIVKGDSSIIDDGHYTEYISSAYYPYTRNIGKVEAAIFSNVNIITFPDGDTTPSVTDSNIFKTNNSSATSITTFDDGVAGQEITVIFGDNNTTIVHGSGIYLKGGADVTPSANTTMKFVYDGSYWYEV